MSTPDVTIVSILSAACGAGPLGAFGMKAATVTDPPFDGSIVRGAVLDSDEGVPDRAVFVIALAGVEDAKLLGVSSRHRVEQAEIFVRGDPVQYAQTFELAETVRSLVHLATVEGYYSIQALGPTVAYVGRDEKMRHGFSMVVELRGVR